MDMSFWTGAVGASAAQNRLGVLSNNLSNINTNGYKPKDASFQELVKYNLHDREGAETRRSTGAGTRVAGTHTDFSQASFASTGRTMDFAISEGEEFFLVQDPSSGQLALTRDGHFHAGENGDGTFSLLTDSGKQVLDRNGQPISVTEDPDALGNVRLGENPGIYRVTFPSRLFSAGDNEFVIGNGDTNNAITATDGVPVQGALENSGTDLAKEMTSVIETQRAMQANLRMVTTSDEVMETINQLRS